MNYKNHAWVPDGGYAWFFLEITCFELFFILV